MLCVRKQNHVTVALWAERIDNYVLSASLCKTRPIRRIKGPAANHPDSAGQTTRKISIHSILPAYHNCQFDLPIAVLEITVSASHVQYWRLESRTICNASTNKYRNLHDY